MVRPITTWYRWDKKKKSWKYNHFEFGVSDAEKPTPESKQQESWNNNKWNKKYGFYQRALGNTRVVEESEFQAPENN